MTEKYYQLSPIFLMMLCSWKSVATYFLECSLICLMEIKETAVSDALRPLSFKP